MMTVSFASLAYENKKKKTRREKFLEEMNEDEERTTEVLAGLHLSRFGVG
jgi:hypothetical protein